MTKNIIKELIIVLLLCLAIILVLGILLYDYVPMSKTIPNPVSYSAPEGVKNELAQIGGIDENQVIMTYEIDSTDLNNYKRIQDYKPGKANPFSTYETTEGNVTSSNTSTGTNAATGATNNANNANSENNTNTNSTTSGGQYFQDKGTK